MRRRRRPPERPEHQPGSRHPAWPGRPPATSNARGARMSSECRMDPVAGTGLRRAEERQVGAEARKQGTLLLVTSLLIANGSWGLALIVHAAIIITALIVIPRDR